MNDERQPLAVEVLPREVTSTIESTIVLLAPDAAAQARDLLASAAELGDIDSDNFNRADEIVARLQGWLSRLELSRKAAKEPVITLGRAIDSVAGGWSDAMTRAKDALSARIAKRLRALEVQRQQAEAAREAALAKAVEQVAAVAALPADTAADEQARDELVLASAVVLLPTVPARPKSAVQLRQNQAVAITDASKIPHKLNGLVLLEPKLANIKKLLVAGVAVPGATLVLEEGTAVRGR